MLPASRPNLSKHQRGEHGATDYADLWYWPIGCEGAAQRFGGALSLWNNVVPFFIRLRDVATHSFPVPEEYIARVEPDIAGRHPSDDWEDLIFNWRMAEQCC